MIYELSSARALERVALSDLASRACALIAANVTTFMQRFQN